MSTLHPAATGLVSNSGVLRGGIQTDTAYKKGFATSATAVKIFESRDVSDGRWSSDCYKLYIKTSFSVIANAQRVATDPGIGVDP
jgi:hypothetical protein